MNGILRNIVVGGFGCLLTVLLLVGASFLLQNLPLPDTVNLSSHFWEAKGLPSGVLATLRDELQLTWMFMGKIWLLWLIPFAGFAVTYVILNHEVDNEELTVYLERIHLLEQALADTRTTAELYSGRWDNLNKSFDALFEGGAEMWVVVDRSMSIRRWNKAALGLARRMNATLEGLEGHPLSDVIPNHDQNQLVEAFQDVAVHGQVWNGEIYLPNMKEHYLGWIFPLGEEVAMVLRDISHRYKDNAFLQSSEKLVRQLVEESVRPVAVLDPEWNYQYVSRKWNEVLGLNPQQALLGMDHRKVMPDFPQERRVVEQQLLSGQIVGRDDERRLVEGREAILSWSIRPWLDAFGRLGGYIFTVVDNTELSRLRQQVIQAEDRENALAYSDALTGLPNRQLFNDRLNMSLAQAYRQLGKVALFFLDLDGFKAVNDNLGHDYGDLLLKQVAERLKACVRTTDTVARLGGDEFTIILAIRDKRDAEQVAEKVLTSIRMPYDLNGKTADHVGTSIGIALYPQDGTQGADLVRKADAAMYGAKQGGKNAFRFSTQEIVIPG